MPLTRLTRFRCLTKEIHVLCYSTTVQLLRKLIRLYKHALDKADAIQMSSSKKIIKKSKL